MSLRGPLVAAVALLASAVPGAAQDPCAAGEGRYHLRPAPEILVVPPPTPADLDAGQVEAGVLTLAIIPRGNASRDWALCLRALQPTLGSGGKDVSDIEFVTAPGDGWTPVAPFDQVVARGRGRGEIAIRFRVRIDWSDDPGAYDSLLALTLVAE